MADRAYMYCPLCRDNSGAKVELMRDAHLFNCPMGHTITQDRMGVLNPEKIKLQFFFKPGPHDVKTEAWVNGEVLSRAKEKLGEQFHPTIDSILRVAVTGDYVLVDGVQAKELRKRNIKNGQEMVACAQDNERLENENSQLKEKIAYFEGIFAKAAESVLP